MKAKVETIDFLGTPVNVLMMPDGTFRISAVQIVDLGFLTSKNTAARDIKRLLGETFESSKTKVENGRKDQLALSIGEFEQLVLELALKGNTKAIEWAKASIGLTMTELASDAFGQTFGKEERIKWFKAREQSRKQYHPLFTSHAKSDGCVEPLDYIKRLAQFKCRAGLPGNLKVEEMTEEQLHLLNLAEVKYDFCRTRLFMSHQEAIEVM